MGLIIRATCGLCNFTVSFNYGANKGNHSYVTNVPAINLTNKQFENVNFIDENLDRDNYLFYHNDELKGNNLDYKTIDYNNLKLNQVNNFCPNCNKFNFDFKGNPIFTD